jgi:hypothetical protein
MAISLSQSRIRASLAAALVGSFVVGCGSDVREPSEHAASSTQADTQSDGGTDFFNVAVKIANEASTVYGVVQKGIALLEALGLIHDPNVGVDAQLAQLKAYVSGVAWLVTEEQRELDISALESTVTHVQENQSSGAPIDWWSVDQAASTSLYNAMDATQFETLIDGHIVTPIKTYVDYASMTMFPYAWWTLIPYSNADLQYVNPSLGLNYAGNASFGYDWRLGVVAFTQEVALRLALMAMEDPNFTTDHRFDAELNAYHDFLKKQLVAMRAGIRCNAAELRLGESMRSGLNPPGPNTNHVWAAVCADIYTGDNETALIYGGKQGDQAWYASTVQPQLDALQRAVTLKMPFFDVQALIDTLYLYTHPGSDLTIGTNEIQISTNIRFCLDVEGANPASGTGVWLWPCSGGPAQQWHYDRLHQTVVNTAFHKCLDVRGADPTPATPAQIWDCLGNDAQRWTYSPEDEALRSSLGNTLDVRGAYFAQGTPVWTWPWYGGAAQRWYAQGRGF